MHVYLFGLYRPRWSQDILDEYKRNLLLNRPDITESQVDYTISRLKASVLDAMIDGYHSLIKSINLPDPKDRHVVAAAINGRADIIVTYNIKDFPQSELDQFNIEAQHPDDFLVSMISLDEKAIYEAFINMQKSFNKPPLTQKEIIEHFKTKENAPKFAHEMSKLLLKVQGQVN
jgi:predicted nucleic acid-binding protein